MRKYLELIRIIIIPIILSNKLYSVLLVVFNYSKVKCLLKSFCFVLVSETFFALH